MIDTEEKIPMKYLYPTIKFTAEYSQETINFLDVTTGLVGKGEGGELVTDLFVKPTNRHQFLDPSSSHPYHLTKTNV